MKTELSMIKKGGIEKRDLINRTAQFICGCFGSGDWRDQIGGYSCYLSFVLNKKESVCKTSLKTAMAAIRGIPYEELPD
jgi:hypothetical protein